MINNHYNLTQDFSILIYESINNINNSNVETIYSFFKKNKYVNISYENNLIYIKGYLFHIKIDLKIKLLQKIVFYFNYYSNFEIVSYILNRIGILYGLKTNSIRYNIPSLSKDIFPAILKNVVYLSISDNNLLIELTNAFDSYENIRDKLFIFSEFYDLLKGKKCLLKIGGKYRSYKKKDTAILFYNSK